MPRLNPEQLAAVQHGEGPLRLIAMAGTGKSTALAERAAHLIERHRVAVDDILLITFSKTARDEMARRIEKRLPSRGAGECSRTFHSVGLMIYKAESKNRDDFTIDTTGMLFYRAVNTACRRLRIPSQPALLSALNSHIKNQLLGVGVEPGTTDPRMIRAADSIAKGSDITGDQLLQAFFYMEDARNEGVEFQGSIQRFVTFDDMIYEAAMLLSRDDVRSAWTKRWRYLLVDEAQDTNPCQMAIADALVSRHRNYTIVGDPAQSIYQFRGTSPESVLGFDKRYPEAHTISLFRNYRSGIEICDLANSIMENMGANTLVCDEFGETVMMHSERQSCAYVGLHRMEHPAEEADRIADNIMAHRGAQTPWEDQAVLVRMNRMTRDIEVSLAVRQIPYRLVGDKSFFSMPEAECLFGYLQILNGKGTATDMSAALRSPSRKLRRKLIEEIVADQRPGEDWLVVADRVARAKGSSFEKSSVGRWIADVQAERDWTLRQKLPPTAKAIVERLRSRLKLDAYFRAEKEESEDSRASENLNAVVRFAGGFETLGEMLQVVETVAEHRRATGLKRKAVTVSTIHGSKGREWPIVYVPCLEQGALPAASGDIAEERRIFYVACTRAKDELWLSWSPGNAFVDADQEPQRSVFLDEVGLEEEREYTPGRKIDTMPAGSQLPLI